MVKYAQAIRRLLPLNCLNVFDHFVGLSLTGLTSSRILTTDPLENQYGKMPKQSIKQETWNKTDNWHTFRTNSF